MIYGRCWKRPSFSVSRILPRKHGSHMRNHEALQYRRKEERSLGSVAVPTLHLAHIRHTASLPTSGSLGSHGLDLTATLKIEMA